MYTFGFGILWVVALMAASRATLLSAAFSHFYIWVHFFCTERPDMRRIYRVEDPIRGNNDEETTVKNFMLLHFGFETPTPEIMGAWGKWFESVADRTVDSGGHFSGAR